MYGARVGEKQFVVVDRTEGNKYDYIFTLAGGNIIFDSPVNSFLMNKT
jgi:hypothetical protein